jgi:predicted aspartyl protease
MDGSIGTCGPPPRPENRNRRRSTQDCRTRGQHPCGKPAGEQRSAADRPQDSAGDAFARLSRDPRGHVALIALVNGVPVRFLVDTGASRVTLTLDDARAVGIGGSELVYSQRSQTANGLARWRP